MWLVTRQAIWHDSRAEPPEYPTLSWYDSREQAEKAVDDFLCLRVPIEEMRLEMTQRSVCLSDYSGFEVDQRGLKFVGAEALYEDDCTHEIQVLEADEQSSNTAFMIGILDERLENHFALHLVCGDAESAILFARQLYQ